MAVRTTRITVEQDTIMVVCHTGTDLGWCSLCGAEVDVITLESKSLAEILAGNEVQRWIAAGKLHLSHQPNGWARICITSLLRCFEPQQVQKRT